MSTTTRLSLQHLFIAIAIAGLLAAGMLAAAHFGAAGLHHFAATGEAADRLQQEMANQ